MRGHRVVVGLEVPEDAALAVAAGPVPETLHVGEVGEPMDAVPHLDRIEGDGGPEFLVVARDPAGVEVGDDAVEIDSEAEVHTRIVGRPSRHPGRPPNLPGVSSNRIEVGLNAVIVAVTDEAPRIITLAGNPAALPTGTLDPALDRTLERALRRWVREGTGIDLGYVEQLYTLGDRDRAIDRDVRLVTVAYLALVKERVPSDGERRRLAGLVRLPSLGGLEGGPPRGHRRRHRPGAGRLGGRRRAAPPDREARRERSEILFGLGGSSWDVERVLERYELLWEIGFVPEAGAEPGDAAVHGVPLILDHRRIAAQALGRLRGKIRYRPLVFELMPETFTLTGLQRVVEALVGGAHPHPELPPPAGPGRTGREDRPLRHHHRRPARRACTGSGARCCGSGPLPESGSPACGPAAERAGTPGHDLPS